MSRTNALILLSILTILAPLSGLPVAVRSFIVILFGVCMLAISFSLRASEVHTTETGIE